MNLLKHKDGYVQVEELPTGNRRIRVEVVADLFMPIKECETSYPLNLIQKILDVKGPAWLCDEILREESPDYVQSSLKYDLLSYHDPEEFKNKRLLDFGCGSGASTMILARMFPDTEIVGVELEEKLLSVARLRAHYYGYKNINLLLSPDANSLPPSIGSFDYVSLRAVYEHLLPNERDTILQQIWSVLKPGGILFLNETPHIGFPLETHTTGLWFINYLPDNLAHSYARRFSKAKLKTESWNELLRKGIRGGSVKEILKILNRSHHSPILLNPCRLGVKDRIALWGFQAARDGKPMRGAKKAFLFLSKLLNRCTGIMVLPDLSLAIQKGK